MTRKKNIAQVVNTTPAEITTTTDNNVAIVTESTTTDTTTPTTDTTTAKMTATEIARAAAECLESYGTMSGIKRAYKELSDKYGKSNLKEVMKYAAGMRLHDINAAAAAVVESVTYDCQLIAAYRAASSSSDWLKLCRYIGIPAVRQLDDESAATAARAFIAAYFRDVTPEGAPLKRAYFVRAGIIYLTYIPATTTATTAAKIFLSAVEGARRAARAAAGSCKDERESRAARVRMIGKVYDAAEITYHPATTDTAATITRSRLINADGKPMTAAAVMSSYDGISVCNEDGTPKDEFQTYTDWKKSVME